MLLAFFCAGVGLSTLEARAQVPHAIAKGGPASLEGELEAVARFDDVTRLTVAVSRANHVPARFRAQLYAHQVGRQLQAGQRVAVAARLSPIAQAANPGERDLAGQRRRRSLRFTGSFAPARLVVASPPSMMRVWLDQTHERLAQRVRALSPSPEAAALYLTLAAGLRLELGETLEEDFSRSGLAHVLSVSGLHVAALAWMTLWLLRRALVRGWPRARRIDARRLAAPLSIPVVWGYVLFTGSQPPAVRSAVMATLVFLAMALWRRADALNGLALAAMAVISFDPSCVADLSMQLSFLAVASLLLLAPALRDVVPLPRPDPSERSRWRYRLQRVRETAAQTLCASLAVTLAGLPLVAGAFQRVSLAGLISNILCLPLCAALTGLAATGAALFLVWPAAATPVLYVGGWASQLLVWATRGFAQLPGAAFHFPGFSALATLLFLAGLALFAIGRGRWRHGALLAPGACLFALTAWAPVQGLEVVFLAVGHGDAVVLSSRGAHALVDGGGVPGGTDTGRKYVLPFLRQRGIDRLDLAVLSHPHPDHALGLASTLRVVPTARLWLAAGTSAGALSEAVRGAAGVTSEEIEAGHPGLRLGDAHLDVLGPPRDRALLEGVNDQSIVLRVRHGAVSFLLTGDVEAAGEEALSTGDVTVLKAPHHGSRTSSSEPFVLKARPRFVVFCVGRNNRFGFPHPEVVERYERLGTRCYRTDLHGAIRFVSDGQDVQVDTFLPGP